MASAILALAVWPHFVRGASTRAERPPAALTAAPLRHDERVRNATIAFYEGRMRAGDPNDPITPRLLAAEYLQRYREHGDPDDVARAERIARRSLEAQPRGNVGADLVLVSALTALHRFHDALPYALDARRHDPSDPGPVLADASLRMELGDYPGAAKLLTAIPPAYRKTAAYATTLSRYEELTGRLAEARRHLDGAMREADSIYDITAERRAWYHFRAGELAFLGGDVDGAVAQERAAIAEFPQDAQAYNALARTYASAHRWREALDAAQRAAALMPLPETLGYVADAEDALGRHASAARIRDEIIAIERIGNARRLNDRLLAVYYDDHDTRLQQAYAIAKRELAVRDDVYTEDTFAWAAAKTGRWTEARRASAKALAYGTQDARLWYHAGVIALHHHARETARRDLRQALDLNRDFHPTAAGIAQRILASL